MNDQVIHFSLIERIFRKSQIVFDEFATSKFLDAMVGSQDRRIEEFVRLILVWP
jgi:hypothetical protein